MANNPHYTIDQNKLTYEVGAVHARPDLATPAAASAVPGVKLGAAEVGLYWGTGAPSIAAAKGSLYIRTDGSSSSTRIYVNSDASTTWVAVTTAS